MSKPILDNLLGSHVRVKLLKLLYRQHPTLFSVPNLVRRIQEPSFIVRRELKSLQSIGLISCRKVANARASEKERFGLNEEFDFFTELGKLMLKSSPTERKRMTKRVAALGRIKLAVIAGILLGGDEQTISAPPADLFIVSNDIDKRKLSSLLKALESEVGGEVRFTVMDQEEFEKRFKYFDRFVRVIMEGPHERLIDKLELELDT